MTPADYISAARVPESLRPQAFGLWQIRRVDVNKISDIRCVLDYHFAKIGFSSYTLLHRSTWATLHLAYGDVVMEDSRAELRKHLPIWLSARGHVLVTGLGLGCVVRGLLASPQVEQITVVEIDRQILRIVGHEFKSNPRVRLVEGDAFTVQLRDRFNYAWHDLYTDGDVHLQVLHAALLARFHKQCEVQGAWQLPRWFKRQSPKWVLR